MTRALTHGVAGYNRGCRCRECCAAYSRYRKDLRARHAERGLDPADPRHGTVNGYTNLGCRCRPCTVVASAVNAANKRARALKLRAS